MARRAPSPKVGRVAATDGAEVLIAKTVKLPRSLDDRLRQFCAVSRRTGQDVMYDAIRLYLDRTDRAGAA